MNNKLKLIGAGVLILQVTGCAALIADSISKQDYIGKNVDVAISLLQSKGYSCRKHTQQSLGTNELEGAVTCSIKESSLTCPKTFNTFLGYDLQTNKVDAFGTNEQTNCF